MGIGNFIEDFKLDAIMHEEIVVGLLEKFVVVAAK